MSFPGEHDASPGFLEKFRHCLSDAGISASTSTPLANAASSAARICAEVKTGRSNQPSRFDETTSASMSAGFDEVFFFFRVLFLADRFDRLFLELLTLV